VHRPWVQPLLARLPTHTIVFLVVAGVENEIESRTDVGRSKPPHRCSRRMRTWESGVG
jgi:hypothetical protein